jgi:DNA-binding NtrC family response regulator
MRQTIPKVLFIGSNSDGADVAEILAQFASVTRVLRVPTALPTQETEAYDAVFCDWDCADGTWRDVLSKLKELHLPIPLIVLSRCGCEKEWIEVLEAGAFDFLVPPYTSTQLLAVLEHALASSQPSMAHSFVTA